MPYFEHESVNHGAGEYVKGEAHTNGMESFWSTLKRAYQGTFHHFSEKHTDRYMTEFSGRHNVRERDTIDQMGHMVEGMKGRRLRYQDLNRLEAVCYNAKRRDVPVSASVVPTRASAGHASALSFLGLARGGVKPGSALHEGGDAHEPGNENWPSWP